VPVGKNNFRLDAIIIGLSIIIIIIVIIVNIIIFLFFIKPPRTSFPLPLEIMKEKSRITCASAGYVALPRQYILPYELTKHADSTL